MTRTSRTLLAALFAAGLAAPFALAANQGRETGPHEQVHADLGPEAGDVDDFVFQAAPGFSVKAVVKIDKGASFAPVLEIVRPSGAVATDVKAKASSKAAKVAGTLVDEGLHALRVRDANGTGTGGFTLKWKLKQAKVDKVKKANVGADATVEYPFAAVDGALVSWKLKFKGDGGAQVVRVLDPDGNDVGFDPEDGTWVKSRKLTSEVVKDFPVTGPGGLYRLVVENSLFPVVLDLSVKVKLPKVAKENVVLDPIEPTLDSISPEAAGCGVTATLTGSGLAADAQGVWFGDESAGGFELQPDGTVTVAVPGGSGTADVIYVAADGQVAVLEDGFTFEGLHAVTGIDPTVGPQSGGFTLTITGTGFVTNASEPYRVVVGTVDASQVQVVDSTTITCIAPAQVAGDAAVRVIDACGQEAASPTALNYGAGMIVTSVRPSAVPTFGGVPLTILGSNMQSDDEVRIDGVLVDSEPYIVQSTLLGHIVTSVPAHAVGTVDVLVRRTSGSSVPDAVKSNGLAFFAFEDISASAIPAPSGQEDFGGVSNALVDLDRDGVVDLIAVSHPEAIGARPGTRVLANDGSGVFSDATGTHAPLPGTDEDWGFGANELLVGRLNGDSSEDLYLSRAVDPDAFSLAGARIENKGSSSVIIPWGRMWFANTDSGHFENQETEGDDAKFSIAGFPHCTICGGSGPYQPLCRLFDYDFRSVAAAIGDLDGDFDDDILLLNDESILDFTGSGTNAVYLSCGGVVQYASFQTQPGSAMRFVMTGFSGGLTDRTEDVLAVSVNGDENFRGVAADITDMNGDFLNDVIITNNDAIGGSPTATRVFTQSNSGNNVTFRKANSILPTVVGGEDDLRGDDVKGVDLNNDLKKDLVVAIDDDPPTGASMSLRILLRGQNDRLEDRTAEVLGGVLPGGDDGRANTIVARDIDKDGDQDLLISTAQAIGTNRRTRLLLNVGKDAGTGFPKFVDASSLFPAYASDTGAAVDLAVGDVDGDGHLDIVLTDTWNGGAGGRRTRIFRQVREAAE